MKSGRMTATVAALVIALLTGSAMAQGPHHRGGGLFGPMMMEMLDLTDAQRAQIKQIHEDATPTLKPLWQQEHQSHRAMMNLITSGNFDQAKAQAIANQEAQIHAQLEVQHAQLMAQAYQVLTPEQKTKLNEFLTKRQQHMEEHMQGHSDAPEN
ncbi:MAG TPA: Spy/CpxP family protein refolding chaperone [Terriglobales bacterium]|nr:Spy/CpxP family protein refolding chaperone [Terriglobales bacterium]